MTSLCYVPVEESSNRACRHHRYVSDEEIDGAHHILEVCKIVMLKHDQSENRTKGASGLQNYSYLYASHSSLNSFGMGLFCGRMVEDDNS